MTASNILEPKQPVQPKVNISARVSPATLVLLNDASEKTGKTKSELVDECIILGLSGKKGGRK